VVDDLHDLPGIDPREIAQELESEVGLVVEGTDDRHDIARPDADLGLVVALADGPQEPVVEAGFEAGLELSVHA
jgi:hypothetical protein